MIQGTALLGFIAGIVLSCTVSLKCNQGRSEVTNGEVEVLQAPLGEPILSQARIPAAPIPDSSRNPESSEALPDDADTPPNRETP